MKLECVLDIDTTVHILAPESNHSVAHHASYSASNAAEISSAMLARSFLRPFPAYGAADSNTIINFRAREKVYVGRKSNPMAIDHTASPCGPSMKNSNRVIVSFYMDNIPSNILNIRKKAIETLIGDEFDIQTILTHDSHSNSIDRFLDTVPYDSILIIDFDCLPLSREAVHQIFEYAERDVLVGAAQRANHIPNGGHLYVGPFCMAFSKDLYKRLGSPSFSETYRSDVGEELTYHAERLGEKVLMMWPSHVDEPLWKLTDFESFGLGTTYSHDFWHAFAIRSVHGQEKFRSMCQKILENNNCHIV